MHPWFAKALILLATVVMILIRAPHGRRSRTIKVAKTYKGPLEVLLLTLAWLGFFLPLTWIATPLLAFADYPLRGIPFGAGVLCLTLSLWVFHRSHADLGTNWSITLEVREKHQLVTNGIYRHVRHPMYLSLLLYSLGQALALPNWVAGPCYLIAFTLLVGLRVGPEERMMREAFGENYYAYMAHTSRLVPGLW